MNYPIKIMPESNSQRVKQDHATVLTVNYPIKIMPESNSQRTFPWTQPIHNCELSYKDNA